MQIYGIEFAPFNIPIKRRMQTLAAAVWFVTMSGGGLSCLFFAICIVLFTSWRWITILYLIWAWIIDRKRSEMGGRSYNWVRDWTWWKYLKCYFPLSLERLPWVELDPKRNYLFCCFPHGMLCTGAFSAFGTNIGGFHDLFPFHTPHPLTLKRSFSMPFFRELLLALGFCDVSVESINYLLGSPGGGKVAILMVGGSSEVYNCEPGRYRIILNNRKGFVRLAIKNGAPLVPVFSFGETNLFNVIDFPKGSKIKNIQEFLRKEVGIVTVLPWGRGLFQYNYGIAPRRGAVTTVVGHPIEVEKNIEPTQEEIDKLHTKFTQELIKLFEDQKHLYIKEYENVKLEIE